MYIHLRREQGLVGIGHCFHTLLGKAVYSQGIEHPKLGMVACTYTSSLRGGGRRSRLARIAQPARAQLGLSRKSLSQKQKMKQLKKDLGLRRCVICPGHGGSL